MTGGSEGPLRMEVLQLVALWIATVSLAAIAVFSGLNYLAAADHRELMGDTACETLILAWDDMLINADSGSPSSDELETSLGILLAHTEARKGCLERLDLSP